MSNQFSYELDERQIRIMLRDGEAENDSGAWNRFEQLVQPDVKTKQASFGRSFNLSISRSVLIPLVFVILIGGLSATLFSFVDFKKKDVKVVKNTPEQQSTAIKASVQPASSRDQQAPPAVQVQPETQSATPEKPLNTPTEQVSATPTPTVQQPAITKNGTKPVVQKTEVKPVEVSPAKTTPTPVVTAAYTKSVQPVVKKRKQKKIVSEEIPTINASSTKLNQESQEPELELH
jgi:hypothetical protein